MDSILNTVKALLGISIDSTDFDQEIIIFINAALGTLHALGVGSATVYSITNATTTWSEFLSDPSDIGIARLYIYMKVKVAFDPPTVSYVLTAFQGIIADYEFRLTVKADNAVIDARPIPVIEEGE